MENNIENIKKGINWQCIKCIKWHNKKSIIQKHKEKYLEIS